MVLSPADKIAEMGRKRDLAIIHLLARKAKLSRPRYEKELYRLTGELSAAALTQDQRRIVLDRFYELSERSVC